MRYLFFALLAAILSPSVSYAESSPFSIGGVAVSQDDIIDARALPGIDGAASLMITLSDAATSRLQSLPATIDILWQGEAIAHGDTSALVASNVVILPVITTSFDQAAALAKAISGKDPLPDSLDESGA